MLDGCMYCVSTRGKVHKLVRHMRVWVVECGKVM